MKKITNTILRRVRNLLLHRALLIPLAFFGAVNLLFWGVIHWSSFEPHSYCLDLGGSWDEEQDNCSIISQCLDKGGCYAAPVPGLLPRDQPWCLFGEDMTPEACDDSQWLRDTFGP
jgi:hypothetical protein